MRAIFSHPIAFLIGLIIGWKFGPALLKRIGIA